MAVEARHHGILGRDVERRANILDHLRRRRRGQRKNPLRAHIAGDVGEFQIIGAEIVAPRRDAVRLVDREKGDRRPRELR